MFAMIHTAFRLSRLIMKALLCKIPYGGGSGQEASGQLRHSFHLATVQAGTIYKQKYWSGKLETPTYVVFPQKKGHRTLRAKRNGLIFAPHETRITSIYTHLEINHLQALHINIVSHYHHQSATSHVSPTETQPAKPPLAAKHAQSLRARPRRQPPPDTRRHPSTSKQARTSAPA